MDVCAELRYRTAPPPPMAALSRFCLPLLHPRPASQPAPRLAALHAGGRLRDNNARLHVGGRCVCVREQRTRTQTYLTDALLLHCCWCYSAANNAPCSALQTAGVQFRMQLCGRACRNWTLARLASYSARLLRRHTRCSDRRSIPSRRSVCLRSCCPPGAAAARKINLSLSLPTRRRLLR